MITDPESNEWADLLFKTVPFDMTIDSPNWWALMVVRKLLDAHHPSIDDAMSYGYRCLTCLENWPCDVYEVIRMEAQRVENGAGGFAAEAAPLPDAVGKPDPGLAQRGRSGLFRRRGRSRD